MGRNSVLNSAGSVTVVIAKKRGKLSRLLEKRLKKMRKAKPFEVFRALFPALYFAASAAAGLAFFRPKCMWCASLSMPSFALGIYVSLAVSLAVCALCAASFASSQKGRCGVFLLVGYISAGAVFFLFPIFFFVAKSLAACLFLLIYICIQIYIMLCLLSAQCRTAFWLLLPCLVWFAYLAACVYWILMLN